MINPRCLERRFFIVFVIKAEVMFELLVNLQNKPKVHSSGQISLRPR